MFKRYIASMVFAAKKLQSRPNGTIMAVLAVALGVGVNVSCFISVNSLVLHALPYPNLNRIVTLWETVPNFPSERDLVSSGNYVDWKQRSQSFEHLSAYRVLDLSLTGTGNPERIQAAGVTPAFFQVLGIEPLLGRTFTEDEGQQGNDKRVVVSQAFWQQKMGSSRQAAGSTIELNGQSYTVTGVMPTDFDLPLGTEMWVPLAATPQEWSQRTSHELLVLGLLKPDVSPARADMEMQSIVQSLQQQYPDTDGGRGAKVIRLNELNSSFTQKFVLILLGAAAFVMLLACSNVANLQLASATDRMTEMAVRVVSGASRLAISFDILAESLMIGLMGGALGLLLADWNFRIVKAGIPPQVFKWVAGLRTMHLDLGTAIFAILISLATGVFCALPAIFHLQRQFRRQSLSELLGSASRTASAGPSSSRIRGAILVTEVALAMILLVGAGMMVQSFDRMVKLDPGYNPRHLLTMQVTLSTRTYQGDTSIASFYSRTLDGLRSVNGISSASSLAYLGSVQGIYVEGQPDPRPDAPRPDNQAVSEDYFPTMQIPILKGRGITAQDRAGAQPVLVVSDSVAKTFWPNSDPIGHRVRVHKENDQWLTVVGICGDRKNWFGGDVQPAVYESFAQAPQLSATLLVRTLGDPGAMAEQARAEIKRVDANQPAYDVKSEEQALAEHTSGVKLSARTMINYAVIGFILAFTGVYSLSSYFVTQGQYEIGIRLAFGATPQDILRLFLGRNTKMAGIGVAIGLVLSFALGQIVASLLYGAVRLSPPVFIALGLLLAGACVVAAYFPARRATRFNPIEVIRQS